MPLPPQVSAFGSDTNSDGGDVWAINWNTQEKVWSQDTKVGEGEREAGRLGLWRMLLA